MTEAEKAAKAFVDAPCTPEQMKHGYRVEYQAFLAGAAWQRETDATMADDVYYTTNVNRDANPAIVGLALADAIRAQSANQVSEGKADE